MAESDIALARPAGTGPGSPFDADARETLRALADRLLLLEMIMDDRPGGLSALEARAVTLLVHDAASDARGAEIAWNLVMDGTG